MRYYSKSIYRLFIFLIIYLALSGLTAFYSPLFPVTYSTILYDSNGELLNGQVSSDGQWRFAPTDSVPTKFKKALMLYEDEWFMYHYGFNPISIVRAFNQNRKAGYIKRGGSTITMQVARMANPKSRTVLNKVGELFMAIKIEFNYSKNDILDLYANHAPFGGNVVGIGAASWRYFGREPQDLSWAEAAMLAVLPNAPSLIRLDKNRERLKVKRNNLLTKLYHKGFIADELEYQLALEEPLPEVLYKLPSNAPHLFASIKKELEGQTIHSSIDGRFQDRLTNMVENESNMLALKGIRNCAALVIDNRTGAIKGYIGNTGLDPLTKRVDIIQSARSSGSILKPFLYSASINNGLILPTTLLLDIPTYYKNFSPNNFDKQFSGATKADEALSRSLNIPAVRLLSDFTPGRFHNLLQQLGFTTVNRTVDNYGLSLILGGAEVSPWEVGQAYYQLAAEINSYKGVIPDESGIHKRRIWFDEKSVPDDEDEIATSEISMGSAYLTMEALTNVARPAEEQGWEEFASHRKIGWKTGTSFGFKDAWAIGVTPEFTVVVWVGNANGDGNNQIIGGLAAAPVMFQIFKMLPRTSWFNKPHEELTPLAVCSQSGYKKGDYCSSDIDTIYSVIKGEQTATCPYHKPIALTADKRYRTNSNTTSVWDMVQENYFILPASVEHYYRPLHPEYRALPPLLTSTQEVLDKQMQILYPEEGAEIYLPKGFSGEQEKLVVKIAHRSQAKKIFWHLDNDFIATTEQIHSLSITPSEGSHIITATDDNGNRAVRRFKIMGVGK